MKAMILERLGSVESGAEPLRSAEMPEPIAAGGEVLIRVHACGVCHTELDEIEGRTPPPRLPVVLGHQVIGRAVRDWKQSLRARFTRIRTIGFRLERL